MHVGASPGRRSVDPEQRVRCPPCLHPLACSMATLRGLCIIAQTTATSTFRLQAARDNRAHIASGAQINKQLADKESGRAVAVVGPLAAEMPRDVASCVIDSRVHERELPHCGGTDLPSVRPPRAAEECATDVDVRISAALEPAGRAAAAQLPVVDARVRVAEITPGSCGGAVAAILALSDAVWREHVAHHALVAPRRPEASRVEAEAPQ